MSQDDTPLTERERSILKFERGWWRFQGAKEDTIRELFDLSPTRYYQILLCLLDRPEAWEFDPMLLKRLTRLRDERRARYGGRA